MFSKFKSDWAKATIEQRRAYKVVIISEIIVGLTAIFYATQFSISLNYVYVFCSGIFLLITWVLALIRIIPKGN